LAPKELARGPRGPREWLPENWIDAIGDYDETVASWIL
jgi:hypothetical protein